MTQPSFRSPRPPALPTLVQYYRTITGQYTTPLPTYCLYAIHHTILVITILYRVKAKVQDGVEGRHGGLSATGAPLPSD